MNLLNQAGACRRGLVIELHAVYQAFDGQIGRLGICFQARAVGEAKCDVDSLRTQSIVPLTFIGRCPDPVLSATLRKRRMLILMTESKAWRVEKAPRSHPFMDGRRHSKRRKRLQKKSSAMPAFLCVLPTNLDGRSSFTPFFVSQTKTAKELIPPTTPGRYYNIYATW